jgi:DNA-binding MarR family transcriptional regulator
MHADKNVESVIDKFWEVIPPLWRSVRKFIHDQAAEEFDITLAQFHILRHIHAGTDSVSNLAKMGRISRPAISRGVDTLVTKGLVSRETDPNDRRRIRLSLSPRGKTLLDELFGNTRTWMMEKMNLLDTDDRDDIIKGLTAFQKSFFN